MDKIEEIVQGMEEEQARFVRYSYNAVQNLSGAKFPRGVPRIHIIVSVRDSFSSKKEIQLWQSYDGQVRLDNITSALEILEGRGLIAVSSDEQRYSLV